MILNYDCLRDTLLKLEEILLITDDLAFSPVNLDALCGELPLYEKEDVFYCIFLLNNARYIQADITYLANGGVRTLAIKTLTWEGHEFLETIRPDSTWQKIKEYLAAVGGKSIHAIKFIGVKLLEAKINTIL